MDRSDIIKLVSITQEQDSRGVWHKTEQLKTVYASVDSCTASEFFNAGRNGLKPAYRISMFVHDYSGEDIIEYNGKRYAVYRTYHSRNDIIELHVQDKAGVQHG